jgi:protein O-GlcNAc transferase
MIQGAIDQSIQTAVRHHQAGRLAEAKRVYLEVLAMQPNNPDALHLLGIIAIQGGQWDQAVDLLSRVILIKPGMAEYQSSLGCVLREQGKLDEAIALWRHALDLKPNLAEAHLHLGKALRERGQLDEAIKASGQFLRMNPQSVEALNDLGNAFQESGRLPEAIAAYLQAARINPNLAETHNNLGSALRDTGQLDEAIVAYRQALSVKPDFSEAHCNLGTVLRDKDQFDQAIAAYRQALLLKPDYAEAYYELAIALLNSGRPDESITACREALRLKPGYAEAYNKLGNAFKEKGQLDQAISAYRRAIELKADRTDAHSNLVYALYFHSDYDVQTILTEHRHWACVHAEPLMSEIGAHDNDRSPDRKLKIAFLSPDLRGHPVGHSLLPFFENRDPDQIEIVCYADVRPSDLITAKLKSLSDQWQDVLGMSDAQVAEKIRRDRIDVLVDTTLHTARNRLLVFAREPAPIQLTMLGPPITTGLSTMHYRLTDPYVDPAGVSDGDYTETSIRLPHCFWIYQPPPPAALPNDLPARRNGFVTFGCLNQFSKVTRGALELWLQVLQSVANSRLKIQSQPGDHLDGVRRLFHGGGIASDRVQFVARTSREQYFRRYHELDICLDPFPFNGHTSSMDALWMGVPTVTLRGRTAVGRGGVSILSNLGLTDWIAGSPEQYVCIASQMAGDLPRLEELRSTLRQRMRNSPLTDGKQFALDVQSAIRRVWNSWCAWQK